MLFTPNAPPPERRRSLPMVMMARKSLEMNMAVMLREAPTMKGSIG